MPLIINELPKREDKVIRMGTKEPEPEVAPPAVPIADVDEGKSLKEAATTPPVVKTVHKERKTTKQPKEEQ